MTQHLLAAPAQHCSVLFRLGRDVEAALFMVGVCTEVQSVMGQQNVEVQSRWTALLTLMLACQEAQDWLALADYLDHELPQLLEAATANQAF
ncbi:hypothetical protein PS662_03777 [Pseudomonas fluorescens]|uniref:Uncharacterized protein n=1 Tax=Pseudomonas fluorescens TaxID=294 RepID=A0A5E6UX17_PSEFL|nr:hypothetical protein [Pseudomonas fluorescens]VVN09518.1 hypothetical protein PS662_03777 [Pseudomonas fluorescens]